MDIRKVNEKYAPSFIAGIMTAILISIILGYNPAVSGGAILVLIVMILYFFGLLLTWVLLLNNK